MAQMQTDLSTARWHPSRYKHHFITNYLSKAKDKYKSSTSILICTAFFLEEFMRSEWTFESEIMVNNTDYDSRQAIFMPVKRKDTEGENEGEDKSLWSLYIVIRGDTTISRFPTRRKNDGNLVITSIGKRNAECERAILRLLYQTAKKPLSKDCPAYGYHFKNANNISQRYFLPIHTRFLDWVKPQEERGEWQEVWRLIATAEAILKEPKKVITDILGEDGEVVSFEIPTSPT
ncbi:hypothetical protein ABW20_dc0110314 [Dactylellina cionopaga]|nr:hypothetical protein ABW20_dc0110314 [Dactylellina cionopaga]